MERHLHGGDYEIKGGTEQHWMRFNDETLNGENDRFYLTVTINMEENTVTVFSSGNSIGTNKCNDNYLDKETICNENIPFTVGMLVQGNNPTACYSHFKLYGCRLYDRVLSNEEIKQNYEQSKDLLND